MGQRVFYFLSTLVADEQSWLGDWCKDQTAVPRLARLIVEPSHPAAKM